MVGTEEIIDSIKRSTLDFGGNPESAEWLFTEDRVRKAIELARK